MKAAIQKYAPTFGAMIALALVASVVGGYILTKQRFYLPNWVPYAGQEFVDYKATLPTAQSITPGQGQTVNIAGVPVGDLSKVELRDGRALVTMKVRKKYTPIFKDATAVVRPKTGLNDMVIELSPGTRRSGEMAENDEIPIDQTLANVNLDEFLEGLDGDTQAYLQLLVGAGGEALGGNGGKQLSKTFKRFEPTGIGLKRITEKLTNRRGNIRRTIHNFRLLSEGLAGKDEELAELVDSSAKVFNSFANQDQRLREALRELPSTLEATDVNLRKVDTLAQTLGPSLQALRPTARALGPALRQTRPFLRDTTPIIRDELRPFARDARPAIRDLRPAARDLAQITPELTRTFSVVNELFNTLAFDDPKDNDESFLFWFGWANHAANSVFGTGDAHGPIRKGLLQLSCSSIATLEQLTAVNENLGRLVSLLDAPRQSEVCPKSAAATRSIASADAPVPQQEVAK